MIDVKVCVGSSCHVRGGAQTLRVFKSLIEVNGLADRVDLSADLCLENCLQAPNVVINGTVFGGITPDKAERFFEDFVLTKVYADADSNNND